MDHQVCDAVDEINYKRSKFCRLNVSITILIQKPKYSINRRLKLGGLERQLKIRSFQKGHPCDKLFLADRVASINICPGKSTTLQFWPSNLHA
jgi:hypothetical protein